MKEITDEYMKQMMEKTIGYTVVILKATEKIKDPGIEKIICSMVEGISRCEKKGFYQLFVQLAMEAAYLGWAFLTEIHMKRKRSWTKTQE